MLLASATSTTADLASWSGQSHAGQDQEQGVNCCACNERLHGFAKSVLIDQSAPERTRTICCIECTGNMQVLGLTIALFATITSAQTVGAVAAHSKALLADTMAMWVDCLTYLLNLAAEAYAGTPFYRHLQLAIPLVSLSTLIYATTTVLSAALATLNSPRAEGDADDVNPYIVLAFSCWCTVFDGTSLCAFVQNHRRTGAHFQLNMAVAAAHVAADLVRSVTEMTEVVLILGFGFDGTLTDAWAGVVVSVTILLGVLFPLSKWCQAVVAFLASPTCLAKGSIDEGCYSRLSDTPDAGQAAGQA